MTKNTTSQVGTLLWSQPPQQHKTRKGTKTVSQLFPSQVVTKQKSNRKATSNGQAKPTQGGLLGQTQQQHPNRNKVPPGHQGRCNCSCCHSVKETLLRSCRGDSTPTGVSDNSKRNGHFTHGTAQSDNHRHKSSSRGDVHLKTSGKGNQLQRNHPAKDSKLGKEQQQTRLSWAFTAR